MTAVEQIEVDPDNSAKVVIDEAAGVIVMGQDVRISTVAIAQGNLTISVQETPQVSQPQPFSQGQTTVTTSSQIKVDEEKGKKLILLKSGASLATLVKGLNSLGVSPRDMISILQNIKADGALQADIEVMLMDAGLASSAFSVPSRVAHPASENARCAEARRSRR